MKSNTTIKTFMVAAVLVLGVAVLASGPDVMAQVNEAQQGVNSIGGGNSPSLQSSVKTMVNAFLFLIGAVAVIMIIYGGFRYVTSAGDSSAVTSAKNTIIYAAVGLVVAISAYAVVNFVIVNL